MKKLAFIEIGWCLLAVAAGIAGGILLLACYFYESLSLLQAAALLPVLFLLSKRSRLSLSIVAGFCMGLVSTIPQMIAMHMPPMLAVPLVSEFTLLLMLLCVISCLFVRKQSLLGCFAVGAAWFILDWLNYTAVPIWGMAQSFARTWSAYPHLIAFIHVTGISGVVFVIGSLQALAVRFYMIQPCRKQTLAAMAALVAAVLVLNLLPRLDKPVGTLRVAAVGWTSNDSIGSFYNADRKLNLFKKLYIEPAAKAAAQGAKIFVSGEMAFHFNESEQDKWKEMFAAVARENNLYLVVGYKNPQAENRLFFMNPEGTIVADYLKTHLAPPEWGNPHGDGDLVSIDIDGVKVGAMICHDDNFSELTRYYGRLKAHVVLVPTWDWQEVKRPHLAAVRARAIEGRYAIARSTYNGITAVIDPGGQILAQRDTFKEGPGFVIADIPIYKGVTVFARLGHWPMLVLSVMLSIWCLRTPKLIQESK